jgi:hypothetical protein
MDACTLPKAMTSIERKELLDDIVVAAGATLSLTSD